MSTVTSDTISASLNLARLSFGHPWKEVHIGPIQNMTVGGRGQRHSLFALQGVTDGTPYGFFNTANLTITDAKHFNGAVELGSFSSVDLVGITATSYTFDPAHDLLRLYQGNRVVDTVNLEVPGNTTGILAVQSFANAVYVGTGYHGLSYGISQHV
jgi:hypothetical protein